jgi:predicted phage terminase large subunit-like protein
MDLFDMVQELSLEDMCFSDLICYYKLMYSKYQMAHHIALICCYLEKLERGDIDRLIILAPPRHGKTTTVAEIFASWTMGRNPDGNIIYATYSHDRASDTGRKVKNLMLDPDFAAVFPDCKVSSDSKSANKLSTQQHGSYFAVGVGGAITGRGADLVILDDLIKSYEDITEGGILKLQEWYSSVLFTRLSPSAKIVLIMTKWSYEDIASYLIEEKKSENWTILRLPAICDEVNPITEKDILGRQLGEALWPERFNITHIDRIQANLTTTEFSALYQQNPLPKSGQIINIDLFNRFDLQLDEEFYKIVLSYDTGSKKKTTSDPSALTVWGMNKIGNILKLINVSNKKMEYPELYNFVIKHYSYYQQYSVCIPTILIEDKSSGISLIQDLKKNTKIPIIAIEPKGNKVERAKEIQPIIESGQIWFPKKAIWLFETETQLSRFPLAAHDDIVDSVTQFLKWQAKPRFSKTNIKFWK